MWQLIKKALRRKTRSAFRQSLVKCAQDLVEAWLQQASIHSFPSHVQEVLIGVLGNLLRWVRGYLNNGSSNVLFKCFGTPQGGILSPLLFNILMHRLISQLPDIPGATITCYADDLCPLQLLRRFPESPSFILRVVLFMGPYHLS